MSGRNITFGIVSPAGPVPVEVFDAGVAGVEKHGFGVKVFPHAREKSGYLSAPAEVRAAELAAAWDDPEGKPLPAHRRCPMRSFLVRR